MDTSKNEVLKSTVDAVLQNGIPVKVDRLNISRWDKFRIKIGLLKPQANFVMYPLVIGTLTRISGLIIGLPGKELWEGKSIELVNNAMVTHGRDMCKILAYAVTNQKKEPSERLVDFFLYNVTPKELLSLYNIIISQQDVVNFMFSITSIQGISLTKPQE